MRPVNGTGREPIVSHIRHRGALPEPGATTPETVTADDSSRDASALEPDAARETQAVLVLPEDFISRCTAVVLLLCLYSALCIFLPTALGIRANPAAMPEGAKPTWSFLFLYEFVRLVPPFVSALAPAVLLVLLGALPFLDRNPSREPRSRVFALLLGLAATIAVAILSYLGWVA